VALKVVAPAAEPPPVLALPAALLAAGAGVAVDEPPHPARIMVPITPISSATRGARNGDVDTIGHSIPCIETRKTDDILTWRAAPPFS
jgi:hypothetical protein